MDEGAPRFVRLRRISAALAALAACAWCFLFGATCIRGGSMEPVLSTGDIVVYRRGASGVYVGDIVLFEKSGWPGGVVHRVVATDESGGLRTQGDANVCPDADPVAYEEVKGVIVAVIPLGRVFETLQMRASDVLHSSTNRMMRSDDGEANGASVPSGTEPHGLGGLRGRAGRFTPAAAT